MWHDPSDSVEPPEGEPQEMSGPDHWVDPVLPQLWNGHFFSNHKQEPTVQVGEGDQNLHHPALQRDNVPLQGEVQITLMIGDKKKELSHIFHAYGYVFKQLKQEISSWC